MEKFLKRYKLQKLTQEEIAQFSIPSKETELGIKTLPTKKSPDPDGFTGEFYQISIFKEELPSILLKPFQN